MDKSRAIKNYLNQTGRVGGPVSVRFLAAGEYNENYDIGSPSGRYVFRINHGSQLGLTNQIEYEFNVLKAVAPSGVTPRPYFCDPHPAGLPGGVLLMDHLPGGPLDYRRDLDKAAVILARIHSLPVSGDLMVQASPVADIARESRGLFSRQPGHPLTEVRRRLEAYHEKILALSEETRELFKAEPLVMVNTEVNSGNFLISETAAYLVDWEKAVVSNRYQDLAHFVVPTTTLWKTDVRLTDEEKTRFLARYREELKRSGAGSPPSLQEMKQKTDIMERTILLRALSWCYMAWHEYTQTDRAIRNEDTFRKINLYFENYQCFLN